ncbi:hypothetical protein C1646_751987 [Rhizophagus diaphanus]|nr:hypothetical protein C1646_751987 [Rhizophagus diaphanus] [Rhizophagus sp. MUCL 43196]
MGLGLIEEAIYSNEYQEKYKILEQEYYKLFINNCKNITNFRWNTSLPLYQYPGASTCFSQLYIENLELWNCDKDVPGLIKFIDNHLHNIRIKNVLLSLKFLPSLINLEQLKLKFENYCYLSEQDWKKYLLIASFPKLQYFKAQYLPPHGVCVLIENSQNIKEIDTWNYFRGGDAKFDEFAFNENWRFSVNNLKNFFEGWRGRKPIKFITRFDKCYHFTQEHVEIVQKYYDEGIIDKKIRFLYGVNDY